MESQINYKKDVMNYTAPNKLLGIICILVVFASSAKAQDKLFFGTDLYFPEDWTEGKTITNRTGTGFMSSSPNFGKTTQVGAGIQINRVGVDRKVTIFKIRPNTYVKDSKNRFCKIEHNKVYKINKKKYRAIGQTAQGIHFLDLKKNKVYVLPAVQIKLKKSRKK